MKKRRKEAAKVEAKKKKKKKVEGKGLEEDKEIGAQALRIREKRGV